MRDTLSESMNERNHQPPCQVGDECELEIHDLAFGGSGVGRFNGYTIFVPFTIPGERVRVRLSKVTPRYAEAGLVEILQASDLRTDPPCPWFKRCAGCQYQHLTYPAQLTAKTQQVQALLQRIGRIADAPVQPIVPAPTPWAYRNKISLHGPGTPAYVGIAHTDRVPVDRCAIAEPGLNQALAQWGETHPKGLAAHEDLTLRSDADGQVWTTTKSSSKRIRQHIAGMDWQTPIDSFFQVHPAMTERLVEHVCARVRASGCRTLIDAYAGVGLFGLSAASHVDQVFAIESDPAAAQAAMEHARSLDQVEVIRQRVESVIDELLKQLPAAETICLLDPPRAGCHPAVLQAIATHQPNRLLYIACAPDRLARDLRTLTAAGYALVSVQPFDVFPQTAHIEVVAELAATDSQP